MRLHHLTVRAFGPFADTEQVDFEQLNEAGLFLLTGPTGAGKSSLLDAVCFALYGTVPGARGVKTLKSQHSPVHVAPEVVLDFSVQGRRFVVRRSPEWSRPKKRGDGLLTEKASASILELTAGSERLLTARAAEVGLLVADLMGMNASQFVQVALLPQGEFQTFLRASSQERHAVLQHLFRTDRFARIEDWVHDESRRLKDESGTGEATVQRIVDTVADRAGQETPEELVGELLAQAAAENRVVPWVSQVLADARAEAAAAQQRHTTATRASVDARRGHDEAVRRLDRLTRLRAARCALEELAGSAAHADEERAALEAHERALRCRPFLAVSAQADAALADAARRRARAVQTVIGLAERGPAGSLSGPVTLGTVSALLETVRDRTARLEALLPREQAAVEAGRQLEADLNRLAAAEAAQEAAAVRAAEVPAELEAGTARLATLAARAARQEAVQLELDAARSQARAAGGLAEAARRVGALHDARRDTRDRFQDARARVQDLVTRRLAGMAAELAGALRDGAECQVCGSTDHPRPASPADDAVTGQDQERAEHALLVAESALDVAVRAVQDAQRDYDALQEAAGGLSGADAAAVVQACGERLTDARAARAEHTSLEQDLQALRVEQDALSRRRADAAATAAGLRQSVAAHERTLAGVAAELDDVLGDSSGAVAPAVRELRETLRGLTAAQDALRELEDLTARADDLAAEARAVAVAQGFPDVRSVEHALLTDDDRDRLAARLRARADAEARAHAVLDDPELAAVEEPVEPEDVGDLSAGAATAEAAASEAARALALHEERAAALALHADRLRGAMEEWAPVRDQALRADAMSKLVRGMGQENQLQMRLSAYVLATRLDQVVAAANERLGHMRDQRYLLRRTGRAERRSAQAGLGLEVLDQWTGDVRAPTTLSGGETFVVSLALALGLADVVTHESGGTEVETLFVDEGFGSLDADTLDDVMDRLDGLRAGGRTVGVVSHVTELRSRIPTQVQVDKGRAGSSITVGILVG